MPYPIFQKLPRLLERVWSTQRFVVYSFDLRLQNVPVVEPDLKVRYSINAASAVDQLCRRPEQFALEARNLRAFRCWMSEGEICVSAWVGEQLAFYGWIQFKYRRPAPLTRIAISPGAAFVYRCYTHSDFRGKRIYPAALAFAYDALKRRGVQRIFVDHGVENIASQRGIERSGAKPIGFYTLFRCCSVRWVRFQPDVRTAISGSGL
jgi:GNAT superfamily N-acetyltransferase